MCIFAKVLVHDFDQKFEIPFFLSSSWWPTLLMEKLAFLQSWTKVLGTVLQYTSSAVISRFPLKTVQPFRNFLAVLPPPPYTKLKLGKNSRYTRPTLFVGWGAGGVGPVWIGKRPRNAKVSQHFFSMIVGYKGVIPCFLSKIWSNFTLTFSRPNWSKKVFCDFLDRKKNRFSRPLRHWYYKNAKFAFFFSKRLFFVIQIVSTFFRELKS